MRWENIEIDISIPNFNLVSVVIIHFSERFHLHTVVANSVQNLILFPFTTQDSEHYEEDEN